MCTCVLSHSVVSESFATLWIVALQAPLSPGLSRDEYWSGLPFPSSRVPPNPGIGSTSLASSALADGFFTTSATWEALHWCVCVCVCVWKLLSRVQLFVIPWTREATHWCINDSVSPQTLLAFFKISIFLAVLGLCCCVQSFSGSKEGELLFVAMWGLLLLWTTGSRHAGSVAVASQLSCLVTCGVFPDQGSNPCLLHRKADSYHCTTREVLH